MVKEFIFNFLKVFVLGLSFLVLSSFFTKELSADDSEGQGLIEQFGDQLKRLFGGREDSDKQSPEDMGGLSEYMEDLMNKAQELWGNQGRPGGLELDMNDPRMADLMKFYQAQLDQRRPSRNEKDHRSVFSEYKPVIASASKSTAAIMNKNGKQVALATVVDSNGLLVTKSSEIPKDGAYCLFSDNKKSEFEILGTDKKWDIALIKVGVKDLSAVNLKGNNNVDLGTFLAASGIEEDPIAVGVASVAPRNLSVSERGFLGVGMENSPDGVKVTMVQNGSGADKAGLKVDDIILKIDGNDITSPAELAKSVSGLKPGDEIKINYKRKDKERTINATLGSRGSGQARFSMPDPGAQFGGPLSSKRVDFPNALQHDLTIRPDECGGPIVNLDGEVVGVNVARGGRVKSYAITNKDLIEVIDSLKKSNNDTDEISSLRSELQSINEEIEEIENKLLEFKKLKEEKQDELERVKKNN